MCCLSLAFHDLSFDCYTVFSLFPATSSLITSHDLQSCIPSLEIDQSNTCQTTWNSTRWQQLTSEALRVSLCLIMCRKRHSWRSIICQTYHCNNPSTWRTVDDTLQFLPITRLMENWIMLSFSEVRFYTFLPTLWQNDDGTMGHELKKQLEAHALDSHSSGSFMLFCTKMCINHVVQPLLCFSQVSFHSTEEKKNYFTPLRTVVIFFIFCVWCRWNSQSTLNQARFQSQTSLFCPLLLLFVSSAWIY